MRRGCVLLRRCSWVEPRLCNWRFDRTKGGAGRKTENRGR